MSRFKHIYAVWQGEDPVHQFEYPKNPNPLEGNSLKPGQRFQYVQPLTVAQLADLYNRLPTADREAIKASLRKYIVEDRKWLDKMDTIWDLADIVERYEPAGRFWAMRHIAYYYDLSPAEIIMFGMRVEGETLVTKSHFLEEIDAYSRRLAEAIDKRKREEARIATLPENQQNTDIAEIYQASQQLEAGDLLDQDLLDDLAKRYADARQKIFRLEKAWQKWHEPRR